MATETDIMGQFLAPKTDVMGERYFMRAEDSNLLASYNFHISKPILHSISF
jgi:hypothetical protein